MKPSYFHLLISVLTLSLATASGQSVPKLEKAFANLALKHGETAKLLKVYPSFQTPLHFLEVRTRDGWTVQVERLARYTEVPMVELTFSIQMEGEMKTDFDAKTGAMDWEDFLRKVKENPTPPAVFDGIGVELRTKMGNAKEVTASVNLHRLPIDLQPNEPVAPGIDALLARLIQMTGVLPRYSLNMASLGIKQTDPHKN